MWIGFRGGEVDVLSLPLASSAAAMEFFFSVIADGGGGEG